MQRTNRGMWLAIGVLAVLFLLAGPLLRFGMPGGGVEHVGGFGTREFAGPGMWGFGLGLFWLVRLVFLGALAWLALAFFRRGAGRGRLGMHDFGSARDVLDRRFAAGEITREQYEEMRHTLAAES